MRKALCSAGNPAEEEHMGWIKCGREHFDRLKAAEKHELVNGRQSDYVSNNWQSPSGLKKRKSGRFKSMRKHKNCIIF